jgi:hypothetical protein
MGRYGLGKVMCGTNSFYDRGYDESEPRTVVVVGFDREFVSRMFESYEVVASPGTRLGSETRRRSTTARFSFAGGRA